MLISTVQPSISLSSAPGEPVKRTVPNRKRPEKLSNGESLLERELRWLKEGVSSPDGFKRIAESRRLFEYTVRRYGGTVEDVARATGR